MGFRAMGCTSSWFFRKLKSGSLKDTGICKKSDQALCGEVSQYSNSILYKTMISYSGAVVLLYSWLSYFLNGRIF